VFQRIRGFRTLFNDEFSGSFEEFVSYLVKGTKDDPKPNGIIWIVDDVGMLYLTKVVAGRDAIAHFTFWDGKLAGRTPLLKEMIKYVFRRYGFRRLTTEFPVKFFALSTVVRDLGFKNEGTRRKAVKINGTWHDVALRGILREELFGI
jgi:hypothetical protein